MASENPPPSIEEISFKEAVQLVGRKPGGNERKDLITFWGFATKNWRWCIDVRMPLEEAMQIHLKLGEEAKVVKDKVKDTGKK